MVKCSNCGAKEEGSEQRICVKCGYMMYPVKQESVPKKTEIKEAKE